jgi:arylsulfatase A-like enzyme
MSDDHAYQAISAYDNALIETPNIDRIAHEGILFSNASVTNSICAPSRATILTGKHSHIHGKIDNISPFDTNQVTFPQLFQKAGYRTAIFGKLHFGNNPKGVDDFAILPGQGDYLNPDFITSDSGRIKIDGYVTDIITDLSIDWLEKQKNSEQPFIMMYFHKAPHRSWWPTPEKMASFSDKVFPEPGNLHDDYSGRGEAAKTAEMGILKHMLLSYDCKVSPDAVAQWVDDIDPRDSSYYAFTYAKANAEQRKAYDPILESITSDFVEQWPSMSDKEKTSWKYQRYMRDYLACISSVDDNVGRALDYLEENGLADNTIVIYTSDQGFYLGEHGWFDKRFMYSESFKTPLMVRWPKSIKPGMKSDEMVQNLDFAPTLLEASGIDVPQDMQGESFLSLLTGKGEWPRENVYYHYYEYPGEHAVKRHYGISSKDYKLIHFYYDVDEWELYDLKKDAEEMNNVYEDPAYSDVLKKMKSELEKLRRKYEVPEDNR